MDKKALFGFCGLILAAVIIITGLVLDRKPAPEEGGQVTVEDVSPKGKIEGSNLYVEQVPSIADDFIMGMDVSSLLAQEASGVKYYDFEGNEEDLLKILAENGINYIRVRVWNDPFDENGNGYGGGNCTIDTALEIGKRATKYGMKLLVDFHYSDFWADPGKQMVPKAWKGMTIDEKEEAVYQYTKESLQKLKDAGVAVGMVQIGNETNGNICGEINWDKMCRIFSAGSRAVREVLPEAKVALHFTNPESEGRYRGYAENLSQRQVDYDVFASSYYPFWHGSLENLQYELKYLSLVYDKEVLVVETSYAYTGEDSDFHGNTISNTSQVERPYPYSVQGQADSVRDVIEVVSSIRGGLGVVYWEGAWITVGQNSWAENSQKWEKYGSGWASSYAGAYDAGDAGQYYGGSAVDNQAMFDPNGRPLESLRIFNLVRYGNDVPSAFSMLRDVYMETEVGTEIELPRTVQAVMEDGAVMDVSVKWSAEDYYIPDKPGRYEIAGEVQGHSVTAYITVNGRGDNLLLNGDFESGDLTGWELTEYGKADELGVEKNAANARSGKHGFHFWSEKQNSVCFRLEQTVRDVEHGKFTFRISIMGGDGGDAEIYAYLTINGDEVGVIPMKMTNYGSWYTAEMSWYNSDNISEMTVGIYVCCPGEGNGAWGSIDDAELLRID